MKTDKLKKILTNRYFILLIITIFALFIRLLNIDKIYGLWNDEAITYLFASQKFPFGIIKVFLKEDFHMPFYYIYLGGWMRIFGTDDITLRLTSVICGVLTIPALFYLGKTCCSEKTGYLLSLIGCLNPAMIYYSQEIRFYSMVTFFSTVSLIFLLKILDTPDKKNIIPFFLTNLLILYTYTMGIVFVAVEMAVIFFHFYKYKKEFLKTFFIHSLIFLFLSIPYFILLSIHIYGANQTIIEPIAWGYIRKPFLLLLINDWFSIFFSCHLQQDVSKYLALFKSISGFFYFLFFTSASLCFITGFIFSLKNLNRKISYLLIIAGTFILTEIFLQLKGNLIIITKYTLIVLPIILLICANGITLIKNKKISYTLISIIFLVYIFNLINYKNMNAFMHRYNGFKYPAQKIMQLNPNNDYFMALNRAQLYRKYLKNLIYIDFDVPGIVYLYKDKTASFNFFNKDFILATNKHNSNNRMIPYLLSPFPTIELQNYINSNIQKIPKGKRLIYLEGPYFGKDTDFEPYINDFVRRYLTGIIKPQTYQADLLLFLISKISIDTKKILKNNSSLIKVNEIRFSSPDYSMDKYVHYKIFVYKKL